MLNYDILSIKIQANIVIVVITKIGHCTHNMIKYQLSHEPISLATFKGFNIL